MAKLTSTQRKNLHKDVFGLPDERAYPLVDAEHVYSAIRYFGSCPVDKRGILAKNINTFAKKYNVTVKLSPSSKFKPYADKSIVKEDATLITECVIPKEVEKILLTESNGEIDPRVASSVNLAIRNAANNYLDRVYYLEGGSDRTDIGDYVYDTDLKICYDITRDFVYGKSIDDPVIVKRLGSLHNKQMLLNAFNNVNNLMRKSPVVGNVINDITAAMDKVPQTSLLDNMESKFKNFDSDFDKAIFHMDIDSEMGYTPTLQKNFSDSEVDDTKECEEIIHKLVSSCGSLLTKKFGYPEMNLNDIVKFKSAVHSMDRRGIIDGFYIPDPEGDLAFIKMKRAIYGIVNACRAEKAGKFIVNALKLFDMDKKNYLHNVYADYCNKGYILPKMPIRRITFKCDKNVGAEKEVFLEGISISSLGDVSFDFDISKTYMDRYSACHKMLRSDEKNKNYDSMKHNVSYLFAMVCTIEGKYIGKSKTVDIGSDDYKDAIKARAFAINDIKRYIGIIQKHDRRFKFMKFYTDNGYDKNIYTISHTTLSGIKNLFRIIMA